MPKITMQGTWSPTPQLEVMPREPNKSGRKECTQQEFPDEMVQPSSHVWTWELDQKEGWAPKNWCFWTVVLEKTHKSPLDYKKTKAVHPKGNQSWIFIGRAEAEVETPILCPPNAKDWLTGKDSDTGKNWRQEEKGATEDEMVGWHHWLNGHEFEQALGDSEGQGSLVCCM